GRAVLVPASLGVTMIGTAMSIFSYPGMCISISANSQVSAAMRRPAGLKESEFSAALGECGVKAISSFTIAEMTHSRKCQRKREWMIPADTTDLAWNGASSMTMVGRTSTSQTIPDQTISIATT